MRRLLLLGIGSLLATTHCYADNEHLKKNMPFLLARKLAIEHGWKPYKIHSSGKDDFPWSGVERQLLDRGIQEISSCSLGETYCNFYYSQKEKCLLLETKGEQIKLMKLVYWQTVTCPPLEQPSTSDGTQN